MGKQPNPGFIKLTISDGEWEVIMAYIADAPNSQEWTPSQVARIWFRTGLDEWSENFYGIEGSE